MVHDGELSYFGKLACMWAVKMGMRRQSKAAAAISPPSVDGVQPVPDLGAMILSDGVFKMKLQAKIDLVEGRICGYEAFAAPVLGGTQLPASVFVPAIESQGLHRPFDWKVLEEGFKMAAGVGVDAMTPISFNVSPVTLCEAGFSMRLEELARAHGVDLDGVKIEVLEKMPLSHLEKIQMKVEMARAKSKGFHFSIDDFGTGDADCSMLKLPVDELKIDAFYVRNLDSVEGEHLVRSMVRLAKSMGLSVCAEGIEHDWQASQLKGLGVDCGQGYLWHRPADAQEAWAAGKVRALSPVAALGDKLLARRDGAASRWGRSRELAPRAPIKAM